MRIDEGEGLVAREGELLACYADARRVDHTLMGRITASFTLRASGQAEKIKASIRAKVEHPFRVLKRQFGYAKVRYRGLAKNTAQIVTLFALGNLWMARRRLMGAAG